MISNWKDSIEKTIKNTMLWLLIAWIWIQSSRFLTAAVIDLSTVVMSAAGSFPSVVMSNSPYIESEIKESVRKAFDVGEWDQVTKVKLIKVWEGLRKAKFVEFLTRDVWIWIGEIDMKGLVDILQPQPKDVAWPLYFIWFSILDIKDITSIDSRNEKWWKATIFNTIIQWWATIIYGFEMAVLCIVAIMRILYLRMFIMISPMAILFRCIQKSSWEKFWWNNEGILKEFVTQLNFETVLVNIFKPAIVVLWLWVAAIFAWLMSNIVTRSSSNPVSYWWVTFSSQVNSGTNIDTPGDVTYTSVMDHNLFNVSLLNVWKTFLELILSVVTVILVYIIIKTAMTMWNWKDFVWKRIDSIQDSVWNILWSTPIIPVSWYDEQGAPTTNYIWARKIFDFKSGTSPILAERLKYYDAKAWESDEKTRKMIAAWFGEEASWSLSSTEQINIEREIKDNNMGQWLQNASKYITSLRNSDDWKWRWLSLWTTAANNWFWRKQFENWLTERKWAPINGVEGFKNLETKYISAWNSMIDRRNKNENNRTLEKMFTSSPSNSIENMQAYLVFFLGMNDSRIENVQRRSEFEKIDISQKVLWATSSDEPPKAWWEGWTPDNAWGTPPDWWGGATTQQS